MLDRLGRLGRALLHAVLGEDVDESHEVQLRLARVWEGGEEVVVMMPIDEIDYISNHSYPLPFLKSKLMKKIKWYQKLLSKS